MICRDDTDEWWRRTSTSQVDVKVAPAKRNIQLAVEAVPEARMNQ